MRQLKDVLKFSPKNDKEAVYKLVVEYIKSQQAEDEYILCDKTVNNNWLLDPEATIYTSFWYSHLCGGGGFYHALTFYLPEWDRPFVRILPGMKFGDPQDFKLIDPEAVEMKRFIRQTLDVVKKDQNRKPWPTFGS